MSKRVAVGKVRAHRWLIGGLQVLMIIGLALALYRGHWQDAVTISGIVILMFIPLAFSRRYRILIPVEFELMAVLFVFASLFLGEIHDYYNRFWWWDIALHTTSGLLLGIFGFLLIYLLNEDDSVDLKLRPRFIALFAFFFAIAIGALWEIFEFSMDQIFGAQMQKPMLGDPSGLTDTMWDIIVDSIGAGIVAVIGWWHLKMRRQSMFDEWIEKFVKRNPRLFHSDN